jgi:hypothetical protein
VAPPGLARGGAFAPPSVNLGQLLLRGASGYLGLLLLALNNGVVDALRRGWHLSITHSARVHIANNHNHTSFSLRFILSGLSNSSIKI